jgi:hypothetical protein
MSGVVMPLPAVGVLRGLGARRFRGDRGHGGSRQRALGDYGVVAHEAYIAVTRQGCREVACGAFVAHRHGVDVTPSRHIEVAFAARILGVRVGSVRETSG